MVTKDQGALLESLFNNQEHTDCEIVIKKSGGTKIAAHKAILAARSPVFAAMF